MSPFLMLVVAQGRPQAARLEPDAAFFAADDARLQYSGRVGFEEPKAASLYYAGNGFKARFRGTALALRFEEDDYGPANSFGAKIDGAPEIPIRLVRASDRTYVVAVGLRPGVHDLEVFRRQDTYGGVAKFRGLWLEKGATLVAPPKRPARRLEVFGDSVTGGTGTVAFGYEARPDNTIAYENADGFLNDGYWGFGAIAARRLRADANIQGIGGIALLDKTGYYGGGANGTTGLVSTWDKLNPLPGQFTPWDFSRFTPDVVVLAIGQNDARNGHLDEPAWREAWKRAYAGVLDGLRGHYPKARFVLTTTVLGHDLAWDAAIREVAAEYSAAHGAGLVRYFGFRRAGRGTPGHPRLAEEEEMGEELAEFLAPYWRR